jgi:pantoate--beta-alanine ligase
MSVQIIESITKMQKIADEWRTEGKKIALVPTMGYLHEGHLSLIHKARSRADVVVVSIYVNPTQFAADEDLDDYPRELGRDTRMAENAGCDFIFAPLDEEMYPDNYLSYVNVEEITKVLCGGSRPTHFRGVTTIVTKLYNAVKPHIVIFGQKDAQQAIVIKQMTRDLNFDVSIEVAPIVREPDGLAMSSRNEYLTPEERRDAPILYNSLQLAEHMIRSGEIKSSSIKDAMREMIDSMETSEIDYISIVNTKTLKEIDEIHGDILIALAVRFGKARLIDNIMLTV